MEEVQKDLRNSVRQQQEKIVYYIIALCVTAIGFSILSTKDKPLEFIQIPLGMAILAWGCSIYYGFRFVKLSISTLASNIEYLSILNRPNPESSAPQLLNAAAIGISEAMKENIKTAGKKFKWQEYLFYLGIIFYLIWHIIEMYNHN